MSNSPDNAEAWLHDALEAFADDVHPAPDAYQTARAVWLRSERRRRLLLAVILAVVFALATLIGLWVLNQAPSAHSADFGSTASLPRCPLVVWPIAR